MSGTRDSVPSDLPVTLEPRLLAALVHDSTVGIAMLDTGYRYVLINERLAEINGIPREAHLGRSVEEMLPELWPLLQPVYDEVLQRGSTITDVAIAGRGAMAGRFFQGGYYPVRDADGAIAGIGVVIDEMTKRRQAESEVSRLIASERAALQSTRAREDDLRAVLSAIPDFIFNLSRDGTHLGYHAPREEALFSEPASFIGRRVRDVLPAEVAAQYEAAIVRALEQGGTQIFDYALDFEDGTRLFDARMVAKSADEVVVIVRDVTELKELEQQLRHSLKMEAIGRLAGGIAHDFNNLLTVINGYGELLEAEVRDGPGAELAAEIRAAGERAASLTRQLLLFSRRQRVEPRVMSINTVVSQAARMLARLVGENVRLSVDLDETMPAIRADPGQLEQVLVNLAVNARDAMRSGGNLLFATRNEPADEVARRRGVTGWATLVVTDDGAGMEPAVRERIFEPFYTTKPPGEGTGLGLAVVFGVVEEYGGTIVVDSQPGAGTTFTVRFPIAEDTPVAEGTREQPEMPRGDETLLLVEDDAAVLGLALRALAPRGYTVLHASGAREALEIARAPGRIDLLISDVIMPDMDGAELAAQIRALRPGLRVLLMSGYADDVLDESALDAHTAFLQKPFSPAVLVNLVRSMLDRRGEP